MRTMELMFSADDGIKDGKYYYWQRYSDWKCSQSFETEQKARKAKEENKLKWAKP